MLRAFAVIAVLVLSGCGSFFGGEDAAVEASAGSGDVVITTKATEDARAQARDFCAQRSLYARLVKAERVPGADPADDAIRWHFDCTK